MSSIGADPVAQKPHRSAIGSHLLPLHSRHHGGGSGGGGVLKGIFGGSMRKSASARDLKHHMLREEFSAGGRLLTPTEKADGFYTSPSIGQSFGSPSSAYKGDATMPSHRSAGSHAAPDRYAVGLGLGDVLARNVDDRDDVRGRQTGQVQANQSPRPAPTNNRTPLTMPTGLPTAYAPGGASDWSYVPRSGAIQGSLPSFMRFDKTEDHGDLAAKVSPLPFGRNLQAFSGSSAYQQQAKRGAYTDRRPGPLDLTHRQGTSSVGDPVLISSSTLPSKISPSTSSPLRGTHHHTVSDSVGHRSLHPDQSSMHSSEGYGSPLIGKHTSAATSATSLRGSSIYKPTRESGELAHTATQASHRNGSHSRATSASISRAGSLDKGKAKQMNASSAPSSVRHKAIELAAEAEMPSFDDAATATTVRPVRSTGNLQTPLSPIAGSTPGQSHGSTSILNESMQSSASQAFEKSLVQHIEEVRAEDEKALEEFERRTQEKEQNVRVTSERAASEHHEALRRYRLLQQLHLDEISSHAPEIAGWLDARNGCERVMMPRPALRGNESQQLRTTGDTDPSAMIFERNRGGGGEDMSVEETSRAQKLLSTGNLAQPRHSDGNDKRPLFHHRLPPDVPFSSDSEETSRFGLHSRQPRPPVPKRSSSRQRHHRSTSNRAKGGGGGDSNLRSPRTPALTPNMLSDDDDRYNDVVTPEIATVVAQGQRLDREREKWREEHRKSMESRSVAHRHRAKSLRSNVDAAHRSHGQTQQEIMQGPSTSLKHTRSSPNLRKQPTEKSPVEQVPRCFSYHTSHKPESPTGERQRGRARSKSFEGLSNLYHSAVSLAAPCMARSVSEKTDGGRPASDRTRAGSRKRVQTLSRYEREKHSEKARAAGRVERRLVSEAPFIVSRQMKDESTSPGLGSGSLLVRYPSWAPPPRDQTADAAATQAAPPNAEAVNHYAAAISSPRPDIGAEGVSGEIMFAHAGRHATKRGYHRPTNSDELASFLHGSQPKVRARKPVPDFADAQQRDSLVGSRALQEGDEWIKFDTDAGSLPVPPRRSRSRSEVSSSLSSALSPQLKKPELGGAAPSKPVDFALEQLSEAQRLRLQSYTQPGSAFQTPPLQQFDHSTAGYPFRTEAQAERAALSGDVTPTQPFAGLARTSSRRLAGAAELRSSRSQETTARPSFDDGASVHARELWNTDNHPEEDFNSLFFRRPKASAAALSPDHQDAAANTSLLDDYLLSRRFTDLSGSESHATPGDEEEDPADRHVTSPLDAVRTAHSRTPSAGQQRDRYDLPVIVDDVVRLGRVDSKRKPHLHLRQAAPDRDQHGSESVVGNPAPQAGLTMTEGGSKLTFGGASSATTTATTTSTGRGTKASVENSRPRHNSLTASILLGPASSTEDIAVERPISDLDAEEEEIDDDLGAVLQYITFASPSTPPPHASSVANGLDDENEEVFGGGTLRAGKPGGLEPAISLAVPSTQSAEADHRRGSANTLASSAGSMYSSEIGGVHDGDRDQSRPMDSIRGLVRSHVWPTPPPASPTARR